MPKLQKKKDLKLHIGRAYNVLENKHILVKFLDCEESEMSMLLIRERKFVYHQTFSQQCIMLEASGVPFLRYSRKVNMN